MGLLTPPSMVPRALVEGPARWAAWSVTWSGWHSPIDSSRDQPRGRWLEVFPGCCDWDVGRRPTVLGGPSMALESLKAVVRAPARAAVGCCHDSDIGMLQFTLWGM